MLAAAGYLQQDIAGLTVDAVIGRQASAALDALRVHRQSGTLGSVVLVQIGNNGPFTSAQFDEMMQLLQGTHQVAVINLKEPRAWEGPNNAVIADGVKRYPNAVLVDWHATSANRPDLFWDDGIHLRPQGAKLYASLVAAVIQGL
jgi:hypothetical protein